MNDELIRALQTWYRDNCDGDWEHQYGVRIDTLDNPGWRVDIDLTGTPLEDKPFEAIALERTKDDWLHVKILKSVFQGHGGPHNLAEIIETFTRWSARWKSPPPADVAET